MIPNTAPDGQTPKASDHTRGSMAEITLYFLRLGCHRANSNVQGFVKGAFAAGRPHRLSTAATGLGHGQVAGARREIMNFGTKDHQRS
jgi:hypothetical protein